MTRSAPPGAEGGRYGKMSTSCKDLRAVPPTTKWKSGVVTVDNASFCRNRREHSARRFRVGRRVLPRIHDLRADVVRSKAQP